MPEDEVEVEGTALEFDNMVEVVVVEVAIEMGLLVVLEVVVLLELVPDETEPVVYL